MRQGAIIIGMMIVMVSIIIYIIKNKETFIDIFNKFKNSKIKYILFSLIIILLVLFIFNTSKEIVNNIKMFYKEKEYDELFVYSDNKKIEENDYYKELFGKEYKNQNYDNPYIPKGFEYIEGTYSDGFVIQDINKNQYVWVPCSNKEIENIPKLQKKNFVSPVFISKDACYDEKYQEFLKSALENGGFYISRYEIGKENNLPVSKSGIEVWNNVSRDEAKEIIANMYKDGDINCELINGFAYDTTLSWLMINHEIDNDIIDIQKEKTTYTGRNSYNRIYDFCDNILELTTEIFYDNVVIRGFSGSESELNTGIQFSEESRYTIFKENRIVSLTDGLSFRTILYK